MFKRKLDPHFFFTIANFGLGLFMHYRVSNLEGARERMLWRRQTFKWTAWILTFMAFTWVTLVSIIWFLYNKFN